MRTGEVVQIGQHRLCCGDAGNPEHVAALFDGAKPDLVFTSPPYLQQRAYDHAIDCWDTMMQRVFGAMPWHERTQVLVNLGLVHRKGEWLPYWDGWIDWMRTQGWQRFGWYVWDRIEAHPGVFGGRFAPQHEFVFHFNKGRCCINKSVASVGAARVTTSGRMEKQGNNQNHKKLIVGQTKIGGSVLSVRKEKNNRTKHPAVFPVALPAEIIKAYTQTGQTVYDPFCGSGTSVIAAEQTGRVAYGMEISSEYCNIAVKRIRKAMAQPCQGALAL